MYKVIAGMAAFLLTVGSIQPAQADTYLAQQHSLIAIHDAAYRRGGVWAPELERYMDCIAQHESSDIPWATGAAGEQGLFQIMPDMWQTYSDANALYKGPYNAFANADTAARMFMLGLSYKWTTTYYCGYW